MGTQQNTDIDYDWLPKETTTEFGMLWFINELVTCPEHDFFIILSTYSETELSQGKPSYTCNDDVVTFCNKDATGIVSVTHDSLG